MGGANKRLGRNEEYRIPSAVVQYLLTSRNPDTRFLPGSERTMEVRRMRMGDVVIRENAEKGKTKGAIMILPGGLIQVIEVLMGTVTMCNLI